MFLKDYQFLIVRDLQAFNKFKMTAFIKFHFYNCGGWGSSVLWSYMRLHVVSKRGFDVNAITKNLLCRVHLKWWPLANRRSRRKNNNSYILWCYWCPLSSEPICLFILNLRNTSFVQKSKLNNIGRNKPVKKINRWIGSSSVQWCVLFGKCKDFRFGKRWCKFHLPCCFY